MKVFISRPSEARAVLPIYGKIGLGLSAAIGCFFLVYFIFEWDEIRAMSPNEFGDLLAGILGPLALIWLVLGFFQQGQELRHSVRALELQTEELRNSVRHQEELVLATREQIDFEKSMVERQAAQMSQRERPIFHVRGGSNSGSDQTGGREFMYEIENIGERATDVLINVDRGAVASLSSRRPVMKFGDKIPFKLHSYPDRHDGDFDLNIECLDINAVHRKFVIRFRKEGIKIKLLNIIAIEG